MKQPRHFFDQFCDPAFHDRKSTVWRNLDPERLTFRSSRDRGDWKSVATMVSRPSQRPTRWFPDANVAFLPETDVVWDALRAAGLGTSGGVTGLTQVALAEIEEWLKLPYRLKERAEKINDALRHCTWLCEVKKPVFPYGLGLRGYMLLLGFRRQLATPHPPASPVQLA